LFFNLLIALVEIFLFPEIYPLLPTCFY
jgi:hypothetical protein